MAERKNTTLKAKVTKASAAAGAMAIAGASVNLKITRTK